MAKYGMPYMGSKTQIADELLTILPPGKRFVDLFGGGGAMTHATLLSGKYESVLYNDYDPLVVDLFRRAISGEFNYDRFKPEWVDREKFFKEKDLDGYIKYCWSFGAKGTSYLFGKDVEEWKKLVHNYIVFDVYDDRLDTLLDNHKLTETGIHNRRLEYARIVRRKNKEKYNKDIAQERTMQQLQQLEQLERLQQLERLEQLELSNISYKDFRYNSGDVVYCDIPYKNTCKYKEDFNHEEFYQWVRQQPYDIYISEQTAPEDFQEIWCKDTRRTLSSTSNTTKVTEKLFLHKGGMLKSKRINV